MKKYIQEIWRNFTNWNFFTYRHILIFQLVSVLICILIIVPRSSVGANATLGLDPSVQVENDSFMDFFNTCYWTFRKEETYSTWKSIYPPFAHLWCQLLYGFFERDFLLTQTQPEKWRAGWLLLPLLFQIALYLFSVGLLIFKKCRQIFSKLFMFGLWCSLLLSFPSFFLIQSGNVLMLSIIFVNFAFCLNFKTHGDFKTKFTWSQSEITHVTLLSLAAAIKPQLFVLIFQFQKLYLYLWAILVCLAVNFSALFLWQPAHPQLIFRNIFGFIYTENFQFMARIAYDSFAINSYQILIELTNRFIASTDRNVIVNYLWFATILCVGCLVVNTYFTYLICRTFHQCKLNRYFQLVIYGFIVYLLNSIYSLADGKYMIFFLPMFIQFILLFPKAKFNLIEFIAICYPFVYLLFLPSSIFQSDSNQAELLSTFYNIPLQFNSGAFTIDNFIRPLALQLFFAVFLARIWREFRALKQATHPTKIQGIPVIETEGREAEKPG